MDRNAEVASFAACGDSGRRIGDRRRPRLPRNTSFQDRPFLLFWLSQVKRTHERDIAEGFGSVYLPYALERKYPGAGVEWGWQ